MKQLLLATALILVPVGVFGVGYRLVGGSAAQSGAPSAGDLSAPSLGELSTLAAITDDVAGLIGAGDLGAAKTRVKDFETLCDDGEAVMRPLNPAAWGAVDDAADALFKALRATTPGQAGAQAAAEALIGVLANPAPASGTGGGVKTVAGIAVSDATGHPLACEDMLATLRAGLASTTATGDAAAEALAKAQALQAKATERCNADDDARADEFSAQALALIAG